MDLVNQLGTGPFKAGTPQRKQLDARIVELTKLQDALSTTPTTPSGWRWEPTGEKFADWWSRQDNEGKNAYLRRMGVTIGFIYPMEKSYRQSPQLFLELGEINAMLSEVQGTTGVGQYFTLMNEYGVAGVEHQLDGSKRIHYRDGRIAHVAADGIGTVPGRE